MRHSRLTMMLVLTLVFSSISELCAQLGTNTGNFVHPSGIAKFKPRWYIDLRTDKPVTYYIPMDVLGLDQEQTLDFTRFTVHLKRYFPVPPNSVYTIEIHFEDFVIVHAHNCTVPGAADSGVSVVERYGATLIATGECEFDAVNGDAVLSVPVSISEPPMVVLVRYLPSRDDVERAGTVPVASYHWIRRNIRGNLPGWPVEIFHSQQRQRGQPTIIWQPGQVVGVPADPSDRPNLGDRVSGGRIWPRDISLIPDDGAVKVGDKIIEWGLEQGWFPWGGYDGTDAWVGLVGVDQNGDGRLQPGEVTGVIGLCPPGGADNDFYVDEKGYVHWINYDRRGNINRHYIYDPSRNLLKIFDGSGRLIYQGPPQNWRNSI